MAPPEARSHWTIAWQRLRRRRLAMVCLGAITVFVLLALLDFVPTQPLQEAWGLAANLRREGFPQGLLEYDFQSPSLIDYFFKAETEDSYVRPLAPVGSETGARDAEGNPIRVRHRHLLGTDVHGEDVLYQTIKACNTALIIGGLTTLIAVPIAVLFGLFAGYLGGRTDDAVQYLYSTLASIPDILLLVGFMTVFGQGILQLCVALGITTWVGLCRLVRGEVLKQRELDYVLAERALGAGVLRITLRHILPNIIPIVIIAATLRFSGLILAESILSWIGIGVKPGTYSWGLMIANSQNELMRIPPVWWNLTAAGAALFVVVLAFNIFGDALRDALDPRVVEEE